MMDRSEVAKRIRQALKRRTGLAWSVTGGRGTAWGWLEIEAAKSRRIMHDDNPKYDRFALGQQSELPWVERKPDKDEVAYCTSQEDREILAEALGINMSFSSVQGVSISPDQWQWYVDRAENGKPEPKPESVQSMEEPKLGDSDEKPLMFIAKNEEADVPESLQVIKDKGTGHFVVQSYLEHLGTWVTLTEWANVRDALKDCIYEIML